MVFQNLFHKDAVFASITGLLRAQRNHTHTGRRKRRERLVRKLVGFHLLFEETRLKKKEVSPFLPACRGGSCTGRNWFLCPGFSPGYQRYRPPLRAGLVKGQTERQTDIRAKGNKYSTVCVRLYHKIRIIQI